MSTLFFPVLGAKESALEMQAQMANSVCRLFTSALPAPDPSTPLSEFTAAQADYDGYVAKTFAAWNDPILAPGTGFMIQSPKVQFQCADPFTGDGNIISGAYVVDANGKLRIVMIFTDTIPMQMAGQGIPLDFMWLFPTAITTIGG